MQNGFLDELVGDEVERIEAVPCRRCRERRRESKLRMQIGDRGI